MRSSANHLPAVVRNFLRIQRGTRLWTPQPQKRPKSQSAVSFFLQTLTLTSLSMDTIGDIASVAQLSGVDAVGLISMIVKSASTAGTHKKSRVEFAQHLKVVGDLLEKLDISELKRHRETREPLEQLEEALRKSFVLVDSCRGMSYLYLLAMGWYVESQFRRARVEIDWYLRLIPLISLVDGGRARDSRPKDTPQQNHYPIDLKVESGHDQSKVDQQNGMMDAKGVKAAADLDVYYVEFPSDTNMELREIAFSTVPEDNKSDAVKRRKYLFPGLISPHHMRDELLLVQKSRYLYLVSRDFKSLVKLHQEAL